MTATEQCFHEECTAGDGSCVFEKGITLTDEEAAQFVTPDPVRQESAAAPTDEQTDEQTAIDAHATEVVAPPKLTREAWKLALRTYFTVRRNRVTACGHKFNPESDPRTNCQDCWFAYLQTNGQMTQIAHECFQEAGRDVLERARGRKFVRMFLKFMSTVARMQKEAEAKKAQETENAESNTGDSSAPAIDRTIGGIPETGGLPESDSTGVNIDYAANGEAEMGGTEPSTGIAG